MPSTFLIAISILLLPAFSSFLFYLIEILDLDKVYRAVFVDLYGMERGRVCHLTDFLELENQIHDQNKKKLAGIKSEFK